MRYIGCQVWWARASRYGATCEFLRHHSPTPRPLNVNIEQFLSSTFRRPMCNVGSSRDIKLTSEGQFFRPQNHAADPFWEHEMQDADVWWTWYRERCGTRNAGEHWENVGDTPMLMLPKTMRKLAHFCFRVFCQAATENVAKGCGFGEPFSIL